MLNNLYIKNFALFDELSVDFDNGLNIISGETGAGKSILINAISLLLGQRTNKNFIGKFSDETIVSASFDSNEFIDHYLEENAFDIDENIVITRRFTKNSSQIKLNNRPINLNTLADISESLLDVHGQHSQLIVLNKSNYIKIIDSFDESTIAIKQKIKENLNQLKKIDEELQSINIDEDQLLREIDILNFQIAEIESFDFDSFDEQYLNEEHKKLTNQTEIVKGLEKTLNIFNEGYQRASLKDYVNDIYIVLSDISEYDKNLEEYLSRITEIRELLNDLSRDIDSYSYTLTFDEEKLIEIERIFTEIQTLKRKYGPEVEDILLFLDDSKKRVNQLNNIETLRAKLNEKINIINKDDISLSNELTKIRTRVIKVLENSIINELSEMNMKNLRFKIELTKLDKITESGMDTLDFLISTNKGQEMKSLNTVASGGEISRFMLALKAVLADMEEVQTIIFDEIDTGISGKTANIVGDKLIKISSKRQLIVITHLPQIASKADNHYLIEKNSDGDITKSNLYRLDEEEKIKEVARLISGSDITELTLNSAKELIKNSKG